MAINNGKVVEISTKTIFWALGIGILTILVYMVRDVIAILLFAIIIASALEPVLEFSQKKKIPRLLSLIIIYLLFFVIFAALIYILLPLLLGQLRDFSRNYPVYFGRIEEA